MNLMRFTIIDRRGTVSFVADCEALGALVAACSRDPRTLEELLDYAAEYYPSLRDYVLSGLAIFDEHNVDGHYEAIHSALRYCLPHEVPVFRVVDELTQQASLQAVKAGVILFNLLARRIVQIQNTYSEVGRAGRIRVVRGEHASSRVYPYRLPPNWTIVP